MIELIGKNRAKLTINMGSGKKRKRRSKVVTYTGKRELQRLYREFEAEAKRKPYENIPVSELLTSYIRYRATLGIKETTIHGYEATRKRIDEAIGDITATELTAYMIEDFVADMAERLSAKTIINTISLLRASYERAVRTGQLESNPCQHVTLPKKERPQIVTFDQEQLVSFWGALDNERRDFKVGYGLCLLCGLRRSEVLGLTEEDINLQFKWVSVNSTRHRIDGKGDVTQDTKTNSSYRTLAIPDILVEDIRKLIEEHQDFRYEHTDYLIQDGFGQPLSPSTFTQHIFHIEKRCGLPHVSVHGLRHTFATMLNSKGIDIARISAELGHSNIGTTLNVYTHVFGNVSASSRGIADTISESITSATSLPLREKRNA